MKKLLQRGGYALAALASVFTMGVVHLYAQNTQNAQNAGNGFRISPVRSEITVDKGKNQSVAITLENPSDSALIAHMVVNDFVASSDESGEPKLILDDKTPTPKNDFKKLVEPVADFNLAGKEKKNFNIKLSVPANANSGGYYGAIRFVPITSGVSNQQDNVGLTASVGTIVLVRVPGNLTERLDLVQLSGAIKSKDKNGADEYKARSFFTSGHVAVITRLKNSGDIHLQPFGKIQVKDTFGKVIAEMEFNDTNPRSNVLPDSTRKFTNDLKQRHWLGRYTIDANLGYSQGSGDLITAKSTFWYIPTVVLYGMIIGILLIVGGVYWLIRRQKARKQHKHDVNKKQI